MWPAAAAAVGVCPGTDALCCWTVQAVKCYYYVRTGEPDKAYELGWDGLPFQIAAAGEEKRQVDLTRI